MARGRLQDLGRRERQIMDAIYHLGEATVAEVRAWLSDPPSYCAVRTILGRLKGKGLLRHRQEGRRYVYSPSIGRERAGKSALGNLVCTFFGGSRETAIAALVELSDEPLTEAELARLEGFVDRPRGHEQER